MNSRHGIARVAMQIPRTLWRVFRLTIVEGAMAYQSCFWKTTSSHLFTRPRFSVFHLKMVEQFTVIFEKS